MDRSLLFVGTEFGVFFTRNGGADWHALDGGIPTIPVRDLTIHPREDDLVCATFGRGFYVLDDISPLRGIDVETLAAEASLFPVKDALWYVPRRPLGAGAPLGKASQGDAYFVAPNPAFGAIFTCTSARRRRPRATRAAKREKGAANALFPVDVLTAEEREQAPAIVLTIRDASGAVVRRLETKAEKGFQRVAWNLRRAPVDAWQRSAEEDEWSDGSEAGAMVAPGTYSVSMALLRGGQLTPSARPAASR